MFCHCPNCGQPVVHDANSAGKQMECPNCRHMFFMPDLGAKSGFANLHNGGLVLLGSLLAVLVWRIFAGL